jgi:hypothetical protein
MRSHGSEVVVFTLKARSSAVVEFRSDRNVAFAGEPFRDVSYVSVYAESFLENEQAGMPGIA